MNWWSDTQSWAVLLGVVAPLLTAIPNQPTWSKPVRQLVAVLVAAVIGVLTCLADGKLTEGMTVLSTVAVVVAASAASYKVITGHLARAVEQATSPDSPSRRF